MSLPANRKNSLTEIESIINESGKKNFSRKQGSWGSFEKRCGLLTNCGWKMGMCKSVSGKDNAINRLYTTGVIRSYPENLIQCLFVDDFVDEISAVYRTEFGMKMRCSPILMIVSEDDNQIWRINRILIQHKHPLLPLQKGEVKAMFPNAELECVNTTPLHLSEGWSDSVNSEECWTHDWGNIEISDTGMNSKGHYTQLKQYCRTPGCSAIRNGMVQGDVNWTV
jgi:hypothetical protein